MVTRLELLEAKDKEQLDQEDETLEDTAEEVDEDETANEDSDNNLTAVTARFELLEVKIKSLEEETAKTDGEIA